jgi:high-affinity iron transporter
MIAATLIAFREGLEAALIVGIVFGYLRKIGQTTHNRHAWVGVWAAIAASIGLAAIIQLIGAELEGQAEEIFEGLTMFLAVGVLTWMIFWMRYQSRTLRSTLEHDIQQALSSGQGRGLMAVTFLAVFREGVETALFLSAAAFATNKADTLFGAVFGLATAVLVGYMIYASTMKLNLRTFFKVTSVLLLLIAAGLLSHGIHEFQEAGLLFTLSETVWDTNPILDENSTLGELLKAVFGYNGNPSLLEVIGYWAYWGVALFGVRWLVERKITRNLSAPQTADV